MDYDGYAPVIDVSTDREVGVTDQVVDIGDEVFVADRNWRVTGIRDGVILAVDDTAMC